MNATNVDYYIVGFKSDGSRAAGKICMFDPIKHPDKLEAEAEKMKADNADIVTVKAVTTEDYMNLLGNNTNGKEYILSGETFVPKPDYVPTEAEEKQAAIATIKAKYHPTLDSLVEARVKAAMLGADTTKIDSQYKTTLANMATEIKNA
ncbi:hypothetical protein [Dialister hominis]|uniref:Uncharacterized protein n=1 Tax=Dialister hominis TaxID=2582419 RepID=A0A8E4BRU5_9FIRM|nr:hypothetical protein [Dialister hominis]BBK24462.1 hypothetical protein Dia5BBH33_03970 [Dialister hominis]